MTDVGHDPRASDLVDTLPIEPATGLLCPHCSKPLTAILRVRLHRGTFWRINHQHVYACPSCRKVLSVGENFKM